MPALESSHALAHAIKIAKEHDKNDIVIVCLSGRGDKDIDHVRKIENEADRGGCSYDGR